LYHALKVFGQALKPIFILRMIDAPCCACPLKTCSAQSPDCAGVSVSGDPEITAQLAWLLKSRGRTKESFFCWRSLRCGMMSWAETSEGIRWSYRRVLAQSKTALSASDMRAQEKAALLFESNQVFASAVHAMNLLRLQKLHSR
jgi:hypothetical protein